MPQPPARVVAVVGPTAAGKTAMSLDLAEALGGEVVNTDAFCLYRGMDIGTAKVPPAERRGIAHHLVDVLDVDEPLSVAQFQVWARAAVEDCLARGVSPVLVGGSALYTRAVLDPFDFPGTDPGVRARLESELEEAGVAALYARLTRVDPAAAEHIEPGNGRRIVRALEVVEITGRPFEAALPPRAYVYSGAVQVGLTIPRPQLDERIAGRVSAMWGAGLVDEVRRLEEPLRRGRTAQRAIGYQQVLAFLAGQCTQPVARTETARATRRFARRQDSWYRKDERIRWVAWDDPRRLDTALTILNGG